MRSLFLSTALLLMLLPLQAQQIQRNATVFIEPDQSGYNAFLIAALIKRHVALQIVSAREKAAYVITTRVVHTQVAQPAIVMNNNSSVTSGSSPGNDSWKQGWDAGQQLAQRQATAKLAMGETEVSVTMIDVQSQQIVFAQTSGKMGKKQIQNTADECAAKLGKAIGK